ncbi:hypothetical protein BH23CHL6_BH23CHL6_07670 [soil metagenome]
MRHISALVVVSLLAAACASGRPPQPSVPAETPAAAATDAPTAGATGTPPATVAPEIVEAIEMRRSLGLRSDLPWVLQIAQSGDAVMSELGFLVTPGEQAELERRFQSQDSAEQLNAYGAANSDQFGGLYIDQAAGGVFVMLFTTDHERHADALASLVPPDVRVEIRPARYSEAELMDLLEGLDFNALRAQGYEMNSAGIDTINNVVRLEAKSNTPNAKALLEARFDGRLVADIFPLPGPWRNAEAGNGWRLLGAGIAGGELAYTVNAALDAPEWAALRQRLGAEVDTDEPDFESEVVVVFGHGIGSSCREVRLDDVVIDDERTTIYSVTSDPLEPRACTADLAGAAVFVVAVERESVPADRFTVQLAAELITGDGTGERIEVDLGK